MGSIAIAGNISVSGQGTSANAAFAAKQAASALAYANDNGYFGAATVTSSYTINYSIINGLPVLASGNTVTLSAPSVGGNKAFAFTTTAIPITGVTFTGNTVSAFTFDGSWYPDLPPVINMDVISGSVNLSSMTEMFVASYVSTAASGNPIPGSKTIYTFAIPAPEPSAWLILLTAMGFLALYRPGRLPEA
jgi:hypothetical protein